MTSTPPSLIAPADLDQRPDRTYIYDPLPLTQEILLNKGGVGMSENATLKKAPATTTTVREILLTDESADMDENATLNKAPANDTTVHEICFTEKSTGMNESATLDQAPANTTKVQEILLAKNSAGTDENSILNTVSADAMAAQKTLLAEKSVGKDENAILSMPPVVDVAAPVNKPLSGASKLRKMIFETQELIVCPGVYDGLSARTALQVGFRAMYMVSLC